MLSPTSDMYEAAIRERLAKASSLKVIKACVSILRHRSRVDLGMELRQLPPFESILLSRHNLNIWYRSPPGREKNGKSPTKDGFPKD